MTRGAFSGKDGTVLAAEVTEAGGSSSGAAQATMYEVTSWNAELSAAIPKHASNATEGAMGGVAGIRDSSGTVEMKVHKNDGIPYGPGQLVELDLRDDGTSANRIMVTAFIEGAPVNVAIDADGEAVTITYNWQGVRPFTGYGRYANLWASY